jgi:hypothetical protein
LRVSDGRIRKDGYRFAGKKGTCKTGIGAARFGGRVTSFCLGSSAAVLLWLSFVPRRSIHQSWPRRTIRRGVLLAKGAEASAARSPLVAAAASEKASSSSGSHRLSPVDFGWAELHADLFGMMAGPGGLRMRSDHGLQVTVLQGGLHQRGFSIGYRAISYGSKPFGPTVPLQSPDPGRLIPFRQLYLWLENSVLFDFLIERTSRNS